MKQKYRSLIALILVFVLIATDICPVAEGFGVYTISTAKAEAVHSSNSASDYVYTIEGGKATITDYLGTATEVIIPSMIEGYSVVCIGDEAFRGCYIVTSVTIPNSVMRIGNYAFYGCNNLANFTFSNNVKQIGNYAFAYCSQLTTVTILGEVTSIGNYAFYGCRELNSITIPESVTYIGHNAFHECGSFTYFYGIAGSYAEEYVTKADRFGQKFVAVEAETFQDSEDIDSNVGIDDVSNFEYTISNGAATITGYFGNERNVIIPSTIERYPVVCIGVGAFAGSYVRSVMIPNSVVEICEFAFMECYWLESILLSNSVKSIGENAFALCEYFTIYGFAGSFAETYAKENGYGFVVG